MNPGRNGKGFYFASTGNLSWDVIGVIPHLYPFPLERERKEGRRMKVMKRK
jgi:hypothetical protein